MEAESDAAWGLDGPLPYPAAHDYVSCLRRNELKGTLLISYRGMQTVWVMGNEVEVLYRVPRPEVEGYLTYGGNVYGNESHWPEVVHFSDTWAADQ